MFVRIKNLKGEKWKPAPLPKLDIKAKYYISNYGRIVSVMGHREILKTSHNSLEHPYLKLTLRKKRSPEVQKKLDSFSEKINKNALEMAKIKRAIRKAGKKEKESLQKEYKKLSEVNKDLISQRAAIAKEDYKKNRVHFSEAVYRMVARAFISEPPSAKHKFVIHKDFNPHNNHVSNLKWATQEELTKHNLNNPNVKRAKRERKRNPIITNSSLTEKQVLEIKKLLAEKKTLRFIAQKFGISDMQVYRIKTGENWGHVKLKKETIKTTKDKKSKTSNKSQKSKNKKKGKK